jgi:hypothetical protein
VIASLFQDERTAGLVWLLIVLGPLLFSQRMLTREIQVVLLLLTRRPRMSLGIFSALFFPGVLLHEASHLVAARLLGVNTGRLSLAPKPLPGGRLRLGFVEVAQTDFLRDGLIGAAPLLAGGVFIAFAGLRQMGLAPLVQIGVLTQLGDLAASLKTLPSNAGFWIWFYLVFAVSSTMFPSPSDRRSWLPLGLTAAVILGLSLVCGAGPWMEAHLAPGLNRSFQAITVMLAVCLAIQLVILVPTWCLHKILSRLTGLRAG